MADGHFLVYWLRSPTMRRYVAGRMTGTNPNIQKINQRTILRFPFPVRLSVTEQRRIALHLDGVQSRVYAMKRLQSETAVELDALLPAILDRAFKRELL